MSNHVEWDHRCKVIDDISLLLWIWWSESRLFSQKCYCVCIDNYLLLCPRMNVLECFWFYHLRSLSLSVFYIMRVCPKKCVFMPPLPLLSILSFGPVWSRQILPAWVGEQILCVRPQLFIFSWLSLDWWVGWWPDPLRNPHLNRTRLSPYSVWEGGGAKTTLGLLLAYLVIDQLSDRLTNGM